MDHLMGGLEKEGRGARNALPTRRSAEPCSGRRIDDTERTPCRARNAIEIAASKSGHSQAGRLPWTCDHDGRAVVFL